MKVAKPSAKAQIRFLQNLQRLLEEGLFSSTYKYALLLALADLSVELGDDTGESLSVPLDAVAEKFVEYYWRQARPYQGRGSRTGQVLLQNTGDQAKVVTLVGMHVHTTIAEVRRDR